MAAEKNVWISTRMRKSIAVYRIIFIELTTPPQGCGGLWYVGGVEDDGGGEVKVNMRREGT